LDARKNRFYVFVITNKDGEFIAATAMVLILNGWISRYYNNRESGDFHGPRI